MEEPEFNQEEKRILNLLGRGLSREFPNQQRVGCPGPTILRSIAIHKLSLSEADPWLDHLSSCSPCFQEFSRIRKEATSQRRRTQKWLAAAEMLIIAVGGWLWMRSRPSGQVATVVVLDLRGRAAVRGENPPDTSHPPLEIPRGAKNLNLQLPIGSNEGAYDVALLHQSRAELVRTSPIAKLEEQILVLRADIDLGGASPGSYFLGVRRPGLEWTRFPIRVL
jgi:hypothetical protein